MQPVIEMCQLSRVFGTDPVVNALNDVSISIAPGERLAIVGASGSGKSTLLGIVGLLDRATSGSYELEGVDVLTLSERERAAVRARRIGFVFQSFHLLAHRSVLDNVMLSEIYRGGDRRTRRARAADTLERVGLSHRLDHLPAQLSGGERQRVAIARALLGEPAILLCDEPTGNLDSENTAAVLDLFDALTSTGVTLVVITHDDDVARRTERVIRLADGRVV